MKTFTQILDDIRATLEAIEESKEQERRLIDLWTTEPDPLSRRAARQSVEEELTTAAQRTRDLQLSVRLMQNNARVALYHEVMPVVVEMLEKYKGKPYGEKTRAKIADEVEQRTGARVYFGGRYDSDEVNIYPRRSGNTYNINVGTVYDTEARAHLRFFDGNKLKPLPLESFQLWYIKSKYIDDIPAALEEMKALHARALELQAQLSAACSEFNRYAVQGIDDLSVTRYVPARLTAN